MYAANTYSSEYTTGLKASSCCCNRHNQQDAPPLTVFRQGMNALMFSAAVCVLDVPTNSDSLHC